ncbi:5-methylcytosine-specific restriction protein A [Bradyrhizobium sp. AZCC 1610]|uniref:HNH endonuclease signature motif containing protein n=1 Tax=Bradyrhizobium sp. AZCC 1610 TaxID=3117020 RepID=UPI002FF30808
MPTKPNRLCSCGRVVASGVLCACQVAHRAEIDRRRPNAAARGYDGQWQKARAGFLAHHPHCEMLIVSGQRCGKPASVVDHIKPHRGDKRLFWLKSNWQPLCTHCHNSKKQRQERGQ